MVETTINEENGIYEIIVAGEVDASSSILLDNELEKAFEQEGAKVLVNLEQLDYISSAGLGVFISRLEEVNEKAIQLAFCSLQDNVHQVFQLLGLEELLSLYPDRNEAIKHLS